MRINGEIDLNLGVQSSPQTVEFIRLRSPLKFTFLSQLPGILGQQAWYGAQEFALNKHPSYGYWTKQFWVKDCCKVMNSIAYCQKGVYANLRIISGSKSFSNFVAISYISQGSSGKQNKLGMCVYVCVQFERRGGLLQKLAHIIMEDKKSHSCSLKSGRHNSV